MLPGCSKQLIDCSLDMLRVADKYGVKYLSETCENYVVSALTPDSSAKILVMASKLENKRSKQKVLEYIAGRPEEFFDVRGFENLADHDGESVKNNGIQA